MTPDEMDRYVPTYGQGTTVGETHSSDQPVTRQRETRSTEGKSSGELEEEIARIREEMDATIRSIEQKFSPGELLDRALHTLGGGPSEYATNLGRSLKDNPLPATLVGIGLTWLMASSGSPGSGASRSSGEWREKAEGARGKVRETASRLSHRAGEITHGMGERIHGAGEKWHSTRESAREKSGEWGAAARHAGERTRSGMDYLLHEQPLLLGALGIAVGAALGSALPPTRQEDAIFGEQRDRTLRRAEEVGREQMEKGRAVAEQGMEAVREETERQIH